MAGLELIGLTKTFPGVRALSGVTTSFRPGAVHALCGENGAGKSTLIKVLAGVYRPDSGEMRLEGRPYAPASPAEALNAGVSVIYQELPLVPSLSVAENVLLGRWPAVAGFIDPSRQSTLARRLLDQVGLDVDIDAPVSNLSVSARQLVEVAKALGRDSRVIAFDEPTSSLNRREAERLFGVIGELKRAGKTVLYVTHRMEEVAELADSATVLRDGSLVRTHAPVGADRLDAIVADMVGTKTGSDVPWVGGRAGPPALEVQEIKAPGLAAPATFDLYQGEVVGVFGLVGSGRSSLLKGIFGFGVGEIKVHGQTVRVRNPRDALAAGIAYVSDDRKAEGIFPELSVAENINLPVRRGLIVRRDSEARRAASLIGRLGVRASLGQPMAHLSGGNQQKALLARWIDQGVKVLLLDEPTRGIDVAAKREIYDLILGLAQTGVAVLVVSSELPEIVGVSDRILVMREGRIVASVAQGRASCEELLRLALPMAL
jgi:L-arabinose transport system ATP-binding protein